MNKIDCDWIFGFGMMVVGLVGLGYGIGVHCKMKKLCEKLDTTIEDLSNDVPIDIPKEVVDQAVERAAERRARYAVDNAAADVISKIKADIHSDVSSAVSDERKRISEQVTDKIAEKVSKIDEDELRKDVVNKAKEQIAAKFDNKLDDILEDFNSNLSNVSRIYRSIAQTIAGTQNARDVMFKMV